MAGMGRPPIKAHYKLNVRLTDEQRQRIEALVGNYGIAAFIREAVEAELTRREARPAGDSKAGSNKD